MFRFFSAFLAVLLLLSTVLFGAACGGGGGGGGGNDDDDSDNTVVALVGVATGSQTRSLANTLTGETLAVRALVVDTSGVGRLVSVSNLRTTAPASVATVSASAGTITAVGSSTALYSVTARVSGQNVSSSLAVSEAGTRVSTTGLVRLQDGTVVAGATIQFLNASGVALATTISGADGRFQANVPTSATQFSVDITALKKSSGQSLYYSTYAYGPDNYEPSFANCGTPLPSPFSGGALPSDVVFTPVGTAIPGSPSGCTITTS